MNTEYSQDDVGAEHDRPQRSNSKSAPQAHIVRQNTALVLTRMFVHVGCVFVPMITDKIKELQALREKAASLEAAVAEERARALAALPNQFGFESVDEFVDAVLAAAGKRPGRRGRPPGSSAGKKRRQRAVITDETRAEVKKLVQAEKTGAEIAKTLGISLPSVQNIKKALGLVQKRK